jgi:hypothetical protein
VRALAEDLLAVVVGRLGYVVLLLIRHLVEFFQAFLLVLILFPYSVFIQIEDLSSLSRLDDVLHSDTGQL